MYENEKIKINLSLDNLLTLTTRQLESFFFITNEEKRFISDIQSRVLEIVYLCFKDIDNKYFKDSGKVVFNSYHSGQYLSYLYFYSNILSVEENNKNLADRLYYLNKIMHSCDIYHEVMLSASFFLEHPVGTVLGRANYGNNFFAMQNCTVGGNKGLYPTIGDNVKLYSGAKVLGKSTLGNNVTLAANTYIKDIDIPEGATVFGQYPNHTIKYL